MKSELDEFNDQQSTRSYSVGDGKTSLVMPGEQKLPTLAEALENMQKVFREGTVGFWPDAAKYSADAVYQMGALLDEVVTVNPKAEARKRSREDLDRKRHDLRRSRGRR